MSAITANPADEPRFAKTTSLCGHWDRVHNLIREIWPVKTSAHLAHAAGISQRAAEMSLRERRQFASDTIVALLDTDHGPDVLLALLDHSERPWVKQFRRMWERERITRELADLQRQLDDLK
jgi:hypothetical protein